MQEATLNLRDLIATANAEDFHAALAAVDLNKVPVMTKDRSIARKEQARLLRELLKSLKIKGVSVTAPNYSMAQSVDVSLPRRLDYMKDDGSLPPYALNEWCPARRANIKAREQFNALLAKAFPNHDNRSDSQSDYFDYCWSLN